LAQVLTNATVPITTAESNAVDTLQRKIAEFLGDIPIGAPGAEGATSERRFDAGPLVHFAEQAGLHTASAEEIYRQYVDSKHKEAEAQLMESSPQSLHSAYSKPDAEGHFEAFMDKKSPQAAKGWQQRYFVFSNGMLTYYSQKTTQAMFEELDQENLGYLDMAATEQLCKQMGRSLKAADLEAMHAELDLDKNGRVEFAEFDAWWQVNGGKALKKSSPKDTIDVQKCRRVETTATAKGEPIIILDVPGKREMQLKPAAADTDRWVSLLKAAVDSGSEAREKAFSNLMSLSLTKRETGFGMKLTDELQILDPGPVAGPLGAPLNGRVVSLNGITVSTLRDENGLLAVLRGLGLAVGETCVFQIQPPDDEFSRAFSALNTAGAEGLNKKGVYKLTKKLGKKVAKEDVKLTMERMCGGNPDGLATAAQLRAWLADMDRSTAAGGVAEVPPAEHTPEGG
jgi:hypothetical protein